MTLAAFSAQGCCPPCVNINTAADHSEHNTTIKPSGNPLRLPNNSRIRQDRKLLSRVLSTPHNYFRAINIPFATEVCRRFKGVMMTQPAVNLHGDAHLEQFAITPNGSGLADFDDSVSGPPVIDLVRFGVSIELTCAARGWAAERDAIIDAFLNAYAKAIDDPNDPPAPALVRRARDKFNQSRSAFLSEVEQRMQQPPETARAEMLKGYRRYVKLMLRMAPGRPASFYKIQRWGQLGSSGIGSATTLRYLARIAGPSDAPNDDVILEAKELRDISAVPCVDAPRGNALRVIAGSLGFARHPDPFLAIIPRGLEEAPSAPPWWVQSWIANYTELNIERSLISTEDMREVVQMVGSQMAHGHTNLLPPPYDVQLRALVKLMMKEHDQEIRQAIREMSQLTLDARREDSKARPPG